ncbi:BURP domain-containing protein BNM2C-like [Momordica charantia]|uniref:BURP domain-containing protein BNM2C-like n=1 Tax=Momordica charantia TaxID=3673 RepID=A0A6J1C4C0_MOMCH|nr:BURP domain-containing protein BNM2C-like [Momordica charantia]
MKGPVFITFLSLLLLASIIEASREPGRNEVKEEPFPEATHFDSKPLHAEGEKPFIEDIKPQPNTRDLYWYGDNVKSQPNIHDLYWYGDDVKLQPNTRDLYWYGKDAKLQSNARNLYWYGKNVKPQPSNRDLYWYGKDAKPQPNTRDLYWYGKDVKPQPNIRDLYWYSKDEKIKMVTETTHNSEENNSMDEQHNADHYSSEHMNNNNPTEMIFFTMEDLKLGKKLPFYFPTKDSFPHYFPKEIADSIPFSLKQLPQILSLFSLPSGSPQAQAVEDTLWLCEQHPMKGEIKLCRTSSKSMLDSARSILGLPKNSPMKNLTTSHLSNPHTIFQNYTLSQMPKEIAVPKFFACHSLPYPYAVYLCHSPGGDAKVMQLPLEGDNGDRVEAIAVCHMDTSDWRSNHPSFRVLKTKPGTPVCHVFAETDFLWMSP